MASGGSDHNMSEETFDNICTACAEENVIKEGIKYCVECKGYCCKNCVSVHKTYAPLKKHDLLDISTSQQADQTSKLPSFPTERCSIHQGKVIDMYCGDHDDVGCYACIAIDHKNCNDIHSIPDDVDKITKVGEFDKTSEDLQTITEKLQSTLQESNEIYLKTLEDARENSLLAITEHRREADDMLDCLEEEAKCDVESIYSQIKSKLVNANARIELVLNKFEALSERHQRAEGNNAQKFVCSKTVRSVIKKERNFINNVEKEIATFSNNDVMSFVADEFLITNLQEVDTFGEVNINYKLYSTKHCEDIVVKIPSDTKECSIRGCCIFGDNELIISDEANQKLKRVDIANVSVIDYVELPYDIYGVCCVKNNEVAVACNSDRMIQLVSVGQTMSQLRKMELGHKCYHVAYMDNKLYVSDEGCSVYIYDMVGTLLQTISNDASGDGLFEYSEQIALCDSDDYMFVGGYNGLVFLDKKGNHITTVEDPDINGVSGVCVDGIGNVFVAGWNSNNVVQLRHDGTNVGEITMEEHDVQAPVSLCFHQRLCKLFVTLLDNDKLKMFDLE